MALAGGLSDMRIAVVMPRGSLMDRARPNSMETVALTLNARSRHAADIRIICDAGAGDPAIAQLVTVPGGLGKAARRRAVAAILRDLAPAVVEYHQQLGPAADLAKSVRGPVHVLYRHTRIKPPGNPLERFRYFRRLKAFDHLLFVSNAACAEFRSDYPGLNSSISAVCNPVDVEVWRGDVDSSEPLILFSGRALPEKGLDVFCQALALALDRHPLWRGALVLGDWNKHEAWAEPHVRSLARFGDRVEVHYSAPTAKVVEVTRRAAIAVTPSRVAEALGLSALEAHAAGAALISSGRGGLREVSGDHALFVDPPEASGLASAMVRLIEDDGLRRSMARAGQDYVTNTHSPEVRAAELDDLRQRLVEGRAAGSRRPSASTPWAVRSFVDRVRSRLAMCGRTFLTALLFGKDTAARRRGARVRHIRNLPDRRLMAEAYIPAFAMCGGRILWVGCRRYTTPDYTALEAEGAEVWTTDIDPEAARFGHPGRHRRGDLCEIDKVFADITFDAIICNGVFGYGVDAIEQQRQAFAAMAAVLRPGGRLLLGWNTDKMADPIVAGLTDRWFDRASFAGQDSRVRFDSVTHVYDVLIHRQDPARRDKAAPIDP